MKIEFEIEKSDGLVLINALKYAVSRNNNPMVIEKLIKIIGEIEKDMHSSAQAYKLLAGHLTPYVPNVPILINSDLRVHLSLSNSFISHPNGLSRECNQVIIQLSNFYNLKQKNRNVYPDDLKEVKLIEDVVEIIQNKIES